MNDVREPNHPMAETMMRLDELTARLPIAQLLSELQVAVERLSFAGIANKRPQTIPAFTAELDELFDQDISRELMQFIYWLASRNTVSILADKTGELFINYCIQHYREIPEVRFATAVALPEEALRDIGARLRDLYPLPARIIFEVTPSVVAGFVIKERGSEVDRSLKSFMPRAITHFLAAPVQQEANHG